MHVYIAKKEGFNFAVEMENAKGKETRVRVRFEKGQFKTNDDDLAAAIDAALADAPGLRRFCHKTDKAAAEALARKHAEMARKTGAHKGGVTAEAAKHAMDTTLAQRDMEMRDKNVDTAAFADENLLLSEQAHVPTDPVPEEVAKPKPLGGIKLGS